VSSYTTLQVSDSVKYTFGPAAPRNGLTTAQARRRAMRAYQDGYEALELRLYEQAEVKYREAVLYDGGEAKYHGALGALLLKRGKLAAAEAALSAAVLLDTENAEYRKLLTEARSRP
jgi:Flp pilus assembly protein TadD